LKILITGGKSALALKLLKGFEGNNLILADYGEVPTFYSTACQFISLGEKNEDTLAHNLLNSCLDHNIAVVLPLHQFEILAIAKANILFNEFNVNVLLPAVTAIENYTNTIGNKKDWIIYKDGIVVYDRLQSELLKTYGEHHNLSGAFYVAIDGITVKLELIII